MLNLRVSYKGWRLYNEDRVLKQKSECLKAVALGRRYPAVADGRRSLDRLVVGPWANGELAPRPKGWPPPSVGVEA